MRTLALVACCAMAAIVAAEGVLRAFPQLMPAGMLFRLHDQAIDANTFDTRPHRELGYLWQPRTSARIDGWQSGFSFTTDQHGFRNPNPWPERADVVVIGDSQAFGFGVDDNEVWVRQLAERMPEAEIVNLGLIGAAPQQFLKVFEAYGAPLQPKVVLVAFFPPNAIKMGRLFNEWEADGRPGGFDERRFGGAVVGGRLDTIKGSLRGSYALLGLYHGLRAAGTSGVVSLEREGGSWLHLGPTRYSDEALRAWQGHPDFRGTITALEALHRAVEAHGARMIAVPFPTKEEVHLPLLGVPFRPVVAPFRAELERRGIPYIDLIPHLRARAVGGEKLFLDVDLHPDREGHQRIAEIFIEHLTAATPGSSVLARNP